jgi:hypothetical protein
MKKKFIITTTINSPTEAILKYDNMEDWNLIVVGDKKTPKDYKLQKGLYLSPEDQETLDKDLSDSIGWNCIQRRNFGILKAVYLGADIIATIDDDNIPLENWGKDILIDTEGSYKTFNGSLIAFDPIFPSEYKNIWHRGFPIQLLNKRNYSFSFEIITPQIQANFWNGDPDIDAICRMEHQPNCKFDDKIFPFSSKIFSPFNSQNTIISKSVVKDYFLFPHIGRMDDIWASFYVESKGYSVLYDKATVYQERNEHDLTKDFSQEVIGYENTLNLLNDLKVSSENIFKYLPERSADSFKFYKRHFNHE